MAATIRVSVDVLMLFTLQVLISLLVVSFHLALVTAQDQQENEIVDELREEEEGEEGVVRPISDETRKERLRSFFTRNRVESSDSEDAEDAEVKKPRFQPRNRLVRPTAAKPEEVESDDSEDDDDLEGFSQSVSVSQSVSTSVSTRRVRPISKIIASRKEQEIKEKQEEEVAAAEEEKEEDLATETEEKVEEKPTQRKRFRLVKTARNQGTLVERLLKNFDQQNEVGGTRGRRIRFRPSVRRDQIRRKTQKAVDVIAPEVTTTFRPRFRLRGEEKETTLAETTVTTGRPAVTGQEEETIVTTSEPVVVPIVVTETETPQILGNNNTTQSTAKDRSGLLCDSRATASFFAGTRTINGRNQCS